MKVYGIQCLTCGDTIYSVARHDFNECSCGGHFIDGGSVDSTTGILTPERWGFTSPDSFKHATLEVDATIKELYDDYNRSLKNPRKYGRIKGELK